MVGCCTREIAVPWKESLQVVELGLWSMSSTAAVVNRPFLNLLGQTTCSLSYLSKTVFVMSVDMERNLLHEIHIPNL